MLRFGIVCALLAPAADEGQVRWVKLEEALGRSAADGKPTVVFCATDLLVEGPPVKGMDPAFKAEAVRGFRDDFHFVKCADLKTVKAVRAVSRCELIVLDPERSDILRTVVKSSAEIAAALKGALAAYARRPIVWTSDAPPAESGKPLLVLYFGDESADGLAAVEALEDRRVSGLHEKCVFVRIAYRKDSAEARQWNVQGAPSFLLLDSKREFKPASVVERLWGKKTPREMRSFLGKGLAAIERGRR